MKTQNNFSNIGIVQKPGKWTKNKVAKNVKKIWLKKHRTCHENAEQFFKHRNSPKTRKMDQKQSCKKCKKILVEKTQNNFSNIGIVQKPRKWTKNIVAKNVKKNLVEKTQNMS